MLNNLLKKLARKFSSDELIYLYPVEKQRKFISNQKTPNTAIDRSFLQYKAQMKLKGFPLSLFINLFSIPLALVYLFKPSKKAKNTLSADAVFIKDGGVNDKILPLSLQTEFSNLKSQSQCGNLLKWKDRRYILKLLFTHFFSPHFVLKSELKIMSYRYIIELYHPKALIVHNEYSFTSSMLTDFCNKNGVELINVMHGEKLYYMRDSFFRFNRCYVWDEHYKNLFIELRADPDQFIIEAPPSIKFDIPNVEKTVDFTYYFQTHSPEEFRRITDALKQLALQGNKVAIRPHPRFTNLEELNKYIDGADIEIEKNSELSIETSILRTKNVVSKYSTVLFQAYSNGVTAVVDDISNPEFYKKLDELKFVMLTLNHKLISEFV